MAAVAKRSRVCSPVSPRSPRSPSLAAAASAPEAAYDLGGGVGAGAGEGEIGGTLIFPASGLLRGGLDDDDMPATGADTPYGFASYLSTMRAPTPAGPLSPATAAIIARAAAGATSAAGPAAAAGSRRLTSPPSPVSPAPAPGRTYARSSAAPGSPAALSPSSSSSVFFPQGVALPPAVSSSLNGSALLVAGTVCAHGGGRLLSPPSPALPHSTVGTGARAGAGIGSVRGPDDSGSESDADEPPRADSEQNTTTPTDATPTTPGPRKQARRRRAPPLTTYPYLMLADDRMRPMAFYTVSHHSEPSYAEFSLSNLRGFAAFLNLLPR
jgi:DNA polymerase-3 subunit gamma/tau